MRRNMNKSGGWEYDRVASNDVKLEFRIRRSGTQHTEWSTTYLVSQDNVNASRHAPGWDFFRALLHSNLLEIDEF